MKNLLFIYFLLLIVLSACTSSQWPPEPSQVHLGEDSCSECRMIISDERYGAQLFDRGKPVDLFDDYGCLLSRRGVSDSSERVVYVRSLEDASWIREDQAFYVVSKQISSPMGYGIAAFAANESAARFAQGVDDSEIYSFSGLVSVAEKIVHAGFQRKE